MTNRELRRKTDKHRHELMLRVKRFLAEALDKTEEEIKALYVTYESDWYRYCNRLTKDSKAYTLLIDSFEEAVRVNGYPHTKRLKGKVNEKNWKACMRVFSIMRFKKWYHLFFQRSYT